MCSALYYRFEHAAHSGIPAQHQDSMVLTSCVETCCYEQLLCELSKSNFLRKRSSLPMGNSFDNILPLSAKYMKNERALRTRHSENKSDCAGKDNA